MNRLEVPAPAPPKGLCVAIYLLAAELYLEFDCGDVEASRRRDVSSFLIVSVNSVPVATAGVPFGLAIVVLIVDE